MTIEQTIDILPNRRLEMDLPYELPLGRALVRLNIFPVNHKATVNDQSAFGCLHRFADSEKIYGEKDAWLQTVVERYGKN